MFQRPMRSNLFQRSKILSHMYYNVLTATVNIINIITITLKINVIFRWNYFSFGNFLFYFIPEIVLVKPWTFVRSSQFFPTLFKFLTVFLFGTVHFLLRKGLCSFSLITESPVKYLLTNWKNTNLSDTLSKKDFTANAFLENIWNVQRSYFRIQYTAIYCECFDFHSFKLIRKLSHP